MCACFSAPESLRSECMNKRKKKTLQSKAFHCLFAIFSNNSRVLRFTYTVIESRQLDLLHSKGKRIHTFFMHQAIIFTVLGEKKIFCWESMKMYSNKWNKTSNEQIKPPWIDFFFSPQTHTHMLSSQLRDTSAQHNLLCGLVTAFTAFVIGKALRKCSSTAIRIT